MRYPAYTNSLKSQFPRLHRTKRTPSVNQDGNLNSFGHTSQIHVSEFMPFCDQQEGLRGPGDFLGTVVISQASRWLWK